MTSVRFLPLLLAVGSTTLGAQQPPDARWLPWLGCWHVGETAPPDAPLVCVRPAPDPAGVELITVTGGRSIAAIALIADGQAHDVTDADCQGSRVTRFSADGRRVYLRATLTCQEGQRRTASGIMAMASPTTWLDVQSIDVNGELVPQVVHYSPAPPARWPADLLVPTEQAERVADARMRAAGPMTLSDVAEAAGRVDPDALATFLLERRQRFDLTAAGLAGLDDAAVPASVIDALVAATYPARFAVVREETQPVLPPVALPRRERDSTTYGGGWWGYWPCIYGMYCGPYGYGADYLYRPDHAYRRYQTLQYGVGFSGVYLGRMVIVDRTERARGVAVSGSGYTRSGASNGTGSYAQPRNGSAGSSVSSSGSSSSGGQSGAGKATSGGYSRGGGSTSSGNSSGTAASRHRE
jgi:hypothetical protein